MNVPLKSANWSGDLTFKKHYLKEIQQEYPPNEESFGLKLLEQWDAYKSGWIVAFNKG